MTQPSVRLYKNRATVPPRIARNPDLASARSDCQMMSSDKIVDPVPSRRSRLIAEGAVSRGTQLVLSADVLPSEELAVWLPEDVYYVTVDQPERSVLVWRADLSMLPSRSFAVADPLNENWTDPPTSHITRTEGVTVSGQDVLRPAGTPSIDRPTGVAATLPPILRPLSGRSRIVIRNPNQFSVQVQLRSDDQARNVIVGPGGSGARSRVRVRSARQCFKRLQSSNPRRSRRIRFWCSGSRPNSK